MIIEIITVTVIAAVTGGTVYTVGQKKLINKHKKNQEYIPQSKSAPNISTKDNKDE